MISPWNTTCSWKLNPPRRTGDPRTQNLSTRSMTGLPSTGLWRPSWMAKIMKRVPSNYLASVTFKTSCRFALRRRLMKRTTSYSCLIRTYVLVLVLGHQIFTTKTTVLRTIFGVSLDRHRLHRHRQIHYATCRYNGSIEKISNGQYKRNILI